MIKLLGSTLLVTLALMLHAGNGKTVKVSDFKPQKEDATVAVQSALNSGAAKVIFDKLPYDYLVKPVELRGNQEVVISDGVKIRAMPGQFHGLNDCLFSAVNIKNLLLRGEGSAELTMNKADYQDSNRYSRSEWRNAIAILGCENVTVRNLKISKSGGDGIYINGSDCLGGNHKAISCKNVTLENLVSADNHRNGCTVISAEKLLIKNCKFQDTKGIPPQAGIDFEPNRENEVLVDCVVENCEFINNAAIGACCTLQYPLVKPVSVTFKNCRFANNRYSNFAVWAGGRADKPVIGTIDLIDCRLDNGVNRGVVLNNQRENGVKINLRDVVIDNRRGSKAPIMLYTQFNDNISNIDFGNTVILQDLKKTVFEVGELGAAGISPLGGSIVVKADNGNNKKVDLGQLSKQYPGNPEMRKFATLPLNVKNLVPVSDTGVGKNPFRLRGKTCFLQYAKAEEPIELVFTIIHSYKGMAIKIPVTVTDANNTFVEKFVIDSKKFTYRFVPKYNSVFSFSFSTINSVNISSSAPGQGYDTSKRLTMMTGGGDFYFQVPMDLETVKVELWGDMNEPVAAELYDQTGKLVAKVPRKYGIQLLTAKRQPSTKPELWKLKIISPAEDHGIRLGAPLIPIVFTNSANVLESKK